MHIAAGRISPLLQKTRFYDEQALMAIEEKRRLSLHAGTSTLVNKIGTMKVQDVCL